MDEQFRLFELVVADSNRDEGWIGMVIVGYICRETGKMCEYATIAK